MMQFKDLPKALATIIFVLLVGCTTTSSQAQASDTPTSSTGDQASSQAQPAIDEAPETIALLKRIEEASSRLQTLKTRVRYTRVQGLTGDEQRRFGDFYYAAGVEQKPTRFAVLFDRLVIDERARPMQTWYVFDGHWLLERDHDDKTAIRRELVRKDTAATDVLTLGERQMPIPLKLKADEILKRYKVLQLDDVEFGDQMLHHLRLTPRSGEGESVAVELWFDRDSLLLHKIVTEEDGDTIEMLLPNPTLNPEIEPALFETKLPPKDNGWQVQEVPLDQ